MENIIGLRYTTRIINFHRHESGFDAVCKSTVNLAFLRLQPKITRMQKIQQGTKNEVKWKEARQCQTKKWLIVINRFFVWRRLASFHLPSFLVPCWIFCILVILGWSPKKARLTVDLHTASKPFWWRWQLMSLVVYLSPSLFSIEFARIFSSSKFDKR